MVERINPFHDLYLTEAIGPDSFVKLFSPIFMSQGLALYQPGNVILKGLQGSGKTMLLNLLKPETHIAYYKQKVEFPVPKAYRKFISAGINLRKSGIAEFAQLILPDAEAQDIKENALYFGDFVNYWVVDDLIRSIETVIDLNDDDFASEIGISIDKTLLNKFAHKLSDSLCWLGGLEEVESIESLKAQLRDRILNYRNYINLNIDSLPDKIKRTKTVIGEPISQAADLMREVGLIQKETNVFIRIDQYEELPTLDFSETDFGLLCQQIIHKALSSRSDSVSYRIGTRQYAWPSEPVIFSTTGILELKRDYSVVNIDDKLRRSENRSTWLFPYLVEDVFTRRLQLTDYKFYKKGKSVLTDAFGSSMTAKLKAEHLVINEKSRVNILKFDPEWPSEWNDYLKKLSIVDPMSAKLGEAWARQKDIKKRNIVFNPPKEDSLPWNKVYWKKERAEQALTQIASRNKQQLIWQGKDDIVGLSGGNILIFLFICQHIWDSWLRDTRGNNEVNSEILSPIRSEVQTLGILNASEEWQKKPIEGKQSKKRFSVIQQLGERYYKLLIDDLAMSYPGRNGFSIASYDLNRNKIVKDYLKLAVDYGDLQAIAHTSKSKGEKRRKFYLAPILCPAFRISYKHTKEPEYIKSSLIETMLNNNRNSTQVNSSLKNTLNNKSELTQQQEELNFTDKPE